ncbi:MAG TPA: hypothetical protein VIL72_12585 [Beijerinckiaceae bacterium]|jgi:hypothetical protein
MKRILTICAAAASLAGVALASGEAAAKGGFPGKHGGGFAMKHHGGHGGGGAWKHHGGHGGWKGHSHWGHGHIHRHRWGMRPVRLVAYAPGCYRRVLTPYGWATRNVCIYY